MNKTGREVNGRSYEGHSERITHLKREHVNNLIGPMRDGLAPTIFKYLVDPRDRKRLRHEVPLF